MSQKTRILIIGILLVVLSLTLCSCGAPEEKMYSIYFKVDGETRYQMTLKGKEIISLPIIVGEKEGYYFDGWFRDKDVWEDEFKEDALKDTFLLKDITVYAKFSPIIIPNKYTITFVNEDGDDVAPITGEEGANFSYPNMASREEYEFHGWFFDDETFEVPFEYEVFPSEDITVYAKWVYVQDMSKVYYTVTFDGNGGTLISGEQVQQVQHYANAIPPVYEKTGYSIIDFDGWNGRVYGITEDKTITASWKINTYIITFHGNGGVFTDALNAETFTVGYEFNASIVEPEGMYKPFYEVASWRIENGSDNFVINEHSEIPAEDVVLYANWVEKEGTLGLVYENIDEETCKVIGLGEVTDKDIVIPSEYEGKAVVSIGDNAFESSLIEAVKMSDSITSIGENAFLSCAFMDELILSNNLEIIGNSAFHNCVGLVEIILPDSVTSLGSGVFNNCVRLTKITIPSGIELIQESLFFNCYALKEIYINAVEPPELEENAFNGLSEFHIYVPVGSLEAYMAAEEWSEYAGSILSQES